MVRASYSRQGGAFWILHRGAIQEYEEWGNRELMPDGWSLEYAAGRPVWIPLRRKSIWERRTTVPLWPIPAAAGVMTAAVWRSNRRHARSTCPACNYPRAGLPPGAPCPECGRGGTGR